jgi:hypothetical protein
MPGGNVASRPSKPTPTPTKSTGRGNPQKAAKSNDSNKVQMLKRSQDMKKENEKNKNKVVKNKFNKTIIEETPLDPIIFPSFPDSPSTSTTSIKLPEKDNILSLNNNNIDEATIIAMVFEKLGAVELTKFTRTDTVEGINPYYNIISNLSTIKKEFDPSNLVASQKSDTSLYNAFSIKLSNKIPGDQYLEDRGLDNYIYVDTNGDLIIELDNITPDELVEVEIDTNGTIVEVR